VKKFVNASWPLSRLTDIRKEIDLLLFHSHDADTRRTHEHRLNHLLGLPT